MNEIRPVQFGKYLLLDKISTGGTTELYRAKIDGTEGHDNFLAVKRILPHLSHDRLLTEAFLEEAKLAALLNHPCTAQVFEFGEIEESSFIATEYLPGRNLHLIAGKAGAENRPLPLEYGLYISSRVCSGLDYAHRLKNYRGEPLNLTHRDICPPNVIVTYEGDVKIVDFGIGKAASLNSEIQFGMIKEKIAYMSPEKAMGQEIDYRSDIFSTGILLYECTTGSRMFKQNDINNMLSKVLKAEFETPQKIAPNLPPKLIYILHKSLMKNPEDRYSSCGEMQADIQDCIEDCGLEPSSESLSLYMKKLFSEEIQEENRFFREAAVIIGNEEHRKKTNKRPIFLPAAAVLIFAIVLAFIFRSGGKTTDTQYKSTPSSETQIAESTGKSEEPPVNIILTESGSSEIPEPSKPGEPKREKGDLLMTEKVQNKTSGESTSRISFGQAVQALKTENFSQAVTLFETLLSSNPEMIDKISEPYSQALEEYAAKYMESDPEKSKELLLKAVKINPASVSAYSRIGFLYVTLENFKKAIKYYEIAAGLGPEKPEAFFNLGYVYAVAKKYQNAELMYLRTVELEPSYLDEALFNLAVVQDKLGKTTAAVENLERAININPDFEPAKKYIKNLN